MREQKERTMTQEEILKKYTRYRDNVKWHIETNKPTGQDLLDCMAKWTAYQEVVKDLESTPPAPVWVSVTEPTPEQIFEAIGNIFPALNEYCEFQQYEQLFMAGFYACKIQVPPPPAI